MSSNFFLNNWAIGSDKCKWGSEASYFFAYPTTTEVKLLPPEIWYDATKSCSNCRDCFRLWAQRNFRRISWPKNIYDSPLFTSFGKTLRLLNPQNRIKNKNSNTLFGSSELKGNKKSSRTATFSVKGSQTRLI